MVALGDAAMRSMRERRRVAAVRNYRGALVVGASNMIARGVAEAFNDVDPLVRTLGQALATHALPVGKMKEANLRIAKNAQKAVVGGLHRSLPLRSPAYRPDSRLTGALGNALNDEAMTENTSARVISFINQRYLDSKAQHWYRINYGVEGATTQGPSKEARTFVVFLNGQNIATLRDPNPKRQGGIFLPHKFRWDGPQFTPLSKVKTGPGGIPGRSAISRVTGSRAAHFVDLGLEVVAREAGPAYEAILREHVQTARGQRVMARRSIVTPDLRLLPDGQWKVTMH